MARFITVDTQDIQIYFTVKYNIAFSPETYDTVEAFENNIVEAVMDNTDGEVVSWEIVDSDVNDTMLLTNTEYCIEVSARVECRGTCYYDPGRSWGPPEACYPPEVDDVEYEDGMITSLNVGIVLSEVPELSTVDIVAQDPAYEGDIEIDSNYGDWED